MSVDADTREPSDVDLITAVAAGDDDAYGLLWQRHSAAARRFAATLTRPGNVDDLVSEGFLRVFRAIKGGGGPDGAFRTYLFNTIRRYNIDTGRAYGQRVTLTGETESLNVPPAESAGETYETQAEHDTAWQAWQSLPEDSRTLLWHLIVEEETPAQIAPLLGVSANGVASRAVRARERLRQAFLVQHLARADNDECRQARAKLGGYARDALSNRDRTAVAEHLRTCERCAAALAEIADVNHTMRAIVAPLLLGGGVIAGHYLAAAPHAAAATAAATATAAPAPGSGSALRAHLSGTTGKIGAVIGAAACAAGVLTYVLSSGGSTPVADRQPPPAATTGRSIAAPAPRTATESPAPAASSPARVGPVTPTSPPPSSAPPAAPTAPRPAPAVAPPSTPAPDISTPTRASAPPPSSPPAARTRSAPAPTTAPRTSPPASSSAPAVASTQATVRIPLPGGTVTVSASAPSGWTITGWHADTAQVTGGPTSRNDASWQITGGSALVVSATGPTAPAATMSVHVDGATHAYPLN